MSSRILQNDELVTINGTTFRRIRLDHDATLSVLSLPDGVLSIKALEGLSQPVLSIFLISRTVFLVAGGGIGIYELIART